MSASLPSPCVDVCRMHEATGWCEGCCRTLDEIAAWSAMDARHKLQVWKQLPARRESLQPQLDAAGRDPARPAPPT